jgi:hypothetical protein
MSKGWAGSLDDDETIRTQRRPDAEVKFKLAHLFAHLFGLLVAGSVWRRRHTEIYHMIRDVQKGAA